jgi:hypothetical protein
MQAGRKIRLLLSSLTIATGSRVRMRYGSTGRWDSGREGRRRGNFVGHRLMMKAANYGLRYFGQEAVSPVRTRIKLRIGAGASDARAPHDQRPIYDWFSHRGKALSGATVVWQNRNVNWCRISSQESPRHIGRFKITNNPSRCIRCNYK